MNVDFSVETLPLKLPLPFYHNDVQINRVVVQRLYAPELSQLKSALSKQKSSKPSLEYMMFARTFLNLAIVDFYSGETKIDTVANHVLVNRMPPQDIYKIVSFAIMLTKETSLCTTAYRCWREGCGKTTIFDLDPSQPIPKNIEEERALMENFLDFYSESVNKTGKDYFDYKLLSPIKIIGADDAELLVTSFGVKYPALEDYIKNYGDPKREGDVELWALYDNLVSINELSLADTKDLKTKNGFEKIMRIKTADMQGILEKLNEFGMLLKHEFTCKHCGGKNAQPFDYTNFFDFLKSGV